MRAHGRSFSAIRRSVFSALLVLLGCQTAPSGDSALREPDPSHRAQAVAAARLTQDAPPTATGPSPVRLNGSPKMAEGAVRMPDVNTEVPDPVDELAQLDRLLSAGDATPTTQPIDVRLSRKRKTDLRVRDRLRASLRHDSDTWAPGTVNESGKPPSGQANEPLRLKLADAVRRSLQNNYSIQVSAYNPAIEATQIVQAEAQFDAVFFSSFNYTKQDQPGLSSLQGTNSDTRVWQGGIRKLLSTGTQAQASYAMTRSATNLSYQSLNPAYSNQFIVEFQQPLLRGFGLDFNRSQIELSKLSREISLQQFEQQIRETLFNVEQAYWQLLQARRAVTVSARSLEELIGIRELYTARGGYDVYPVQVNQVISQIELQEAQFIELVKNVRVAETVLKGLLNDPELNHSIDVEIIPTDVPTTERPILDQLGEVSAALSHRSELREARLNIERAQIAIGVAKNQALPLLNMTFRYIVDALGGNPDRAFKKLTDNDFNEYVAGLQFEWPIGDRGPEAALRRARLQQAQAIAANRARIEQIIGEVKQVLYDLQSNYSQLLPNLRSSKASFDQLTAYRNREETLAPAQLQVEISAVQALATARLQLLSSLVNYNINIIDLERRKGTLLRYNNVSIKGLEDDSSVKPCTPIVP